uniref:Uncharacterized protein n=1 Tax=Brassica oleracea TaxID=3712 RepID=A0A3P6FBP2_BRAOL|nr:unnamed protein product [Brassica oleracea]
MEKLDVIWTLTQWSTRRHRMTLSCTRVLRYLIFD